MGDDYYQVMRVAGGKGRGVIGDDDEFIKFVGVQRGNRITVHFVDTVDGSSPKETWPWNAKSRTIPGLRSVKLATLKHRYHVAKRILPTCGF